MPLDQLLSRELRFPAWRPCDDRPTEDRCAVAAPCSGVGSGGGSGGVRKSRPLRRPSSYAKTYAAHARLSQEAQCSGRRTEAAEGYELERKDRGRLLCRFYSIKAGRRTKRFSVRQPSSESPWHAP